MLSTKYINREVVEKGRKITTQFICFKAEIEFHRKKHKIYFEIDTGSNGSIMFPNSIALAKPDLVFPENEKEHEIFFHHFGEIPIKKKLRIGIDFKATLSHVEDKPVNCGIIGISILKEYAFNINYAQKTFQLYDKSEMAHSHSCKHEFYKNYVFLYAMINNVEMKFIYDTGFDIGGKFCFFERGFKKLDTSKFKANEKETSPGVLGIVYDIDMYPQKINLHFSNELTHEADFAVMKDNDMTNQIDCDGIIGNHLFLNRELCINYLSQKISFSNTIKDW